MTKAHILSMKENHPPIKVSIRRVAIVIVLLLACNAIAAAQVLTGLDNLVASNYAALKGKRVGLITNKTGRTSRGDFGPHLFASQHVFKLVSLYSPEHGLMGERQAGVASDSAETFEGVPVYSLYGSTRK